MDPTRSDEELKSIRLEYLKDCQPQSYREYVEDGTLEDHLERVAKTARSFAETLVRQGTSRVQAWQWAIRVKLLDSEMD